MVSRIRRLNLTHFRSYEALSVDFSGKPVVLTGENGAGKTNILEALSLLGAGRGMRHARLAELSRQKSEAQADGSWAVTVHLGTDEDPDEARLGVGVKPHSEKRIAKIDGAMASGPSALLEYLRFLWLTPAQDRLFMEGPGERRKFLDRMTLAHDTGHGKRSTAFEQAMRQRQKLFEQGKWDEGWLRGLEAQMAENAVAIAAARREMAARLAAGSEMMGATVFPNADIVLDGALEVALGIQPAADVEEAYGARLMAERRRDAEAGRCLEGPHRSDLLVTHREKSQAARLCSTGEQKALLTGLVLANATALAARPGYEAPLVLLLDEIAAHLDVGRRAALFDILDGLGFQAFMTGTDPELFAAWGDRADHFEVRDGVLWPAETSNGHA